MFFKKQIIVLLSFLVLFTNTGMAFTIHYCDDQIASVSLNTVSFHEIEKDCCGEVERMSKCCHNKIIKSHDGIDQIVAKVDSIQFVGLIFIKFQENYNLYVVKKFNSSNLICYTNNANSPPLYKLYSQYCFYS
jgi:hypothetical protein